MARKHNIIMASILSMQSALQRFHDPTKEINRKRKGRTIRLYTNRKGITGHIVKVCPGGRHAWMETSIGLIRKPI